MGRASDEWDGVVRLPGASLAELSRRHGGRVLGDASVTPPMLAPLEAAGPGDLAPLLAGRYGDVAGQALRRGVVLLADAAVASIVLERGAPSGAGSIWVHEHAAWAMAGLLDQVDVPDVPPIVGARCSIAPGVFLGPRVRVGDRVRIGPGAVVGYPGFGWATGPGGAVRAIPQVGGVVLEDDVAVGPMTTIDAGTLAPTRVGAGTKLDAHVHVGHNVCIGPGTFVAAQCGFAGSVRIGARVLVGGQVGIADHVTVGDGARIAAKSGVIGDVPAGAIVAGYPALARTRWLRGLARLYRSTRARS